MLLSGCGTNNVQETNKEVIAIMDSKIPEVKELFYQNKDIFIETKPYHTPHEITIGSETIKVNSGDIPIDSMTIKNATIFVIESSAGSMGVCMYSISIINFQDELYDEKTLNSDLVKLDNDWYINKSFAWGT